MKKALLVLILVLGINYSYSQNDCSYDEETFRYGSILYIENIPADFSKEDFISHITGLDEISNEDLATLETHLISVYKTIPSHDPSKNVTIVSTLEIDLILAELNNSIDIHYCIATDCMLSNGTFNYYALMRNSIPNDFDKEDFIAYIIMHDNLSNEDLSTLNTHITSLEKAFPTAQTEVLQRYVAIVTTAEI